MNSLRPISRPAVLQDVLIVVVSDDPQLLEGKGQVELGPVDPFVVVGEAPAEALVHGDADGEGRELKRFFRLKIKSSGWQKWFYRTRDGAGIL